MASSADYSPKVFPVVAPPGWKATLAAKKPASGEPCANDAGHNYTAGGVSQPPERPILWDSYEAARTSVEGDSVAHHALDIFAARGAPVVADIGGKVLKTWRYRGQTLPGVGSSERGGYYAWILGDDGVERYYAHLHEPSSLVPGQRVSVGDLVGTVGNTGNASTTCPHLHYATSINGSKFNPYEKLKTLYDMGSWNGFTPNNWGASAFYKNAFIFSAAAAVSIGSLWLIKKRTNLF